MVTDLQRTCLTGYFALVALSALAYARNTEELSLIFRIYRRAFSITTFCPVPDPMSENES